MLTMILTIVASLIVGAVVALRYIAPRTKTLKDDKALEYLERAEPTARDYLDKK